MEKFLLRPLDPDKDFPHLAALLNSSRTQKVSAEQLREWEYKLTLGRLRRTMIAIAENNDFVGRTLVFHRPAAEDGRYYIDVVVHPDQRKMGLGTLLYDDAYQFAGENNGRILDADVYDNCPHCLQFAEKRGFTINRHLFESSLDLSTFDPDQFTGIVDHAEATGIQFFSLAEAGDTEEMRRKLYAVNYQAALDDPASHGTFPSWEQFSSFVFTASWFDPHGQILAADGDKIIGLSAVGAVSEGNMMENMITGVLPEYRGRKIAQALKVIALRFAKTAGADTARTHNDSMNEPMLMINRKLGYKPQVGEYRLIKVL